MTPRRQETHTPPCLLAPESLSLSPPPDTRCSLLPRPPVGWWVLSSRETSHPQNLRPGEADLWSLESAQQKAQAKGPMKTTVGVGSLSPYPRPVLRLATERPPTQNEGIQGFIGSVPGIWYRSGLLSFSWDLPRLSSLGGSSRAC